MENGISIIEDIIRSYPELSEKLQCLKCSGKGIPYGSKIHSDPTAESILAELPPEEQRRYDAIRFAIKHTSRSY
jgi:hypothetical protein